MHVAHTFTGSYDHRLVALSVLIAIFASYAALDLAGRITASSGRVRAVWLAGGAGAMGLGIWSMHYIGMLAYSLPVRVLYDWPTVLVSLQAAILASWVALYVASRKRISILSGGTGGVLMGLGIAAMHYTGMEAMRLRAMCHYSPGLVALSIVLAIVISLVALWLTFRLREESVEAGWRKPASALLMGLAIPVMHYTGMAAVTFTPMDAAPDFTHAVGISTVGMLSIVIVTMAVLAVTILTSLVDRRFSAQSLELSINEQRYRQLVESAQVILWRKTIDPARITFVNQEAEEMLGYPVEDWLREDAFLLEHVHPEDRASTEAQLAASVAGHGSQRFEHRMNAADGRVVWLRTSVRLVEANGKANELVGVMTDITERKHAQEAAEEASRAKSEFLASMSHEIRTPMNGVIGMTELVLETDLTEDQRDCLHTVSSCATSLLTIINDILDFSKIEAGKLQLDPVCFPLHESIEQTMKTLAPQAHQKGLELICDVRPGTPLYAIGDYTRVRQIIVNLVGNAIKFTSRGQVELQVFTESQDREQLRMHFIVRDTGVGIPRDKQALIFEAFSQADGSTTRHFGGTGLGLTISSRLVEAMNGRIWVESELGEGSRFHFTALLGAANDPALLEDEEVSLAGIPVLVVDDNFTNRRILTEMFWLWKMEPTAAAGAAEALEHIAHALRHGNPFALVVTDAHMPEIDGFTLAERIRESPELAPLTVMMLTSGESQGDLQRCRELGISRFLMKPVRRSEMHRAVVDALKSDCRSGALNNRPVRQSTTPLPDHSRGVRILLAEDNIVNQRVASRILEKSGYQVTIAATGREAIAMLERETFDVVLMDVQMPEMDGLEAASAIRAGENGGDRHIPIIAMTAHAMTGDKERCLAAGMDGYISKPIRAQDLLNLVANVSPAEPALLESANDADRRSNLS